MKALAPVFQNPMHPAGPQAAQILDLWWLTLGICAIAAVIVFAFLLHGLLRAPRADEATPADISPLSRHEGKLHRGVIWGASVSTVGLLVLLIASVHTDRALASLDVKDALHIQVTGNQWWWEVTYDDPDPTRIFVTANEMHIPVKRPVVISLRSNDVIHSFWVPNLHGKRDLIPGHELTVSLRADEAGTYRGQCAEFCGAQHAFMAFTVVAQAPEAYEAWADAQRKPAPEPTDDLARRGRDLFLSGPCMMCHNIGGTPATARKGPDLTHVASRPTLAAGTIRNTRENLIAWIRDPHQIKPGVNMPANPLVAEDQQALIAYLETLK
jgi:cytochrome c oxidase subunit 2